ncbi:MAG: T9SS type A sorting domain-containing protein [Bacteroidia bacterium]|nr:T9SS type A sorting domain-containing protein [Bacteroidia bacterium]
MKKNLLLICLAFAFVANAQTKKLLVRTTVIGTTLEYGLYKKQNDSSFALVKSYFEDSGSKLFDSLTEGTYRVHIGIEYNKYIPTWYPGYALWDEAQNIELTADSSEIIVQLIPNPAHTGPGKIGGVLTEGLLKAAGDPLKNVRVVIKDSSNTLIRMTSTDTLGNFLANNLPLGKLKLIVDVVNASTANPKTITLDSTNMSDTTVMLTVNKTGTVTTGVLNYTSNEAITLYPNPATELLFVNTKHAVEVNIYNIQGKLIQKEINDGINPISLKTLKNGLFIVVINSEGNTTTYKLIKQ